MGEGSREGNMESARYVLASLALGAIAVWGSEVLFWSAAPADLTAAGQTLTWVAYSLACACVLSAVAWTGLGGLSGVFLGGALMGWLVEGVVVGQMYLFFPFQLVWTPLAWHALLTAVLVLGVGRWAARGGVGVQGATLLGLGLLGGAWAGYWPLERNDLSGAWGALAYLGGLGLAVPAAMLALDRVGAVPRPRTGVLLVAPAVAAAAWTVQTVAAPIPQRLALPVLLGLTLWAMRRLGRGAPAPTFGPPVAPRRHGLFLIAPVTAALIAGRAWQGEGWEVNWRLAAVTCMASLAWWVALLVRAARA